VHKRLIPIPLLHLRILLMRHNLHNLHFTRKPISYSPHVQSHGPRLHQTAPITSKILSRKCERNICSKIGTIDERKNEYAGEHVRVFVNGIPRSQAKAESDGRMISRVERTENPPYRRCVYTRTEFIRCFQEVTRHLSSWWKQRTRLLFALR